MLKVVFFGSKNRFTQVLVHWLSQRTQLVGVVCVQLHWQGSWRGRWRFARRRMKRYGLAKALDETLFFLYYHSRLYRP